MGAEVIDMMNTPETAGDSMDILILDASIPLTDPRVENVLKKKKATTLPVVRIAQVTSDHCAVVEKVQSVNVLSRPIRKLELITILTDALYPKAETEPVRQKPPQQVEEAKKENRANILVVEDTSLNQVLICTLLEKQNYTYDLVENGIEAVNACAKKKYTLILMDCQMPEMDGFEATKKIRDTINPNRETPIIAMTAHAMVGDREKCIASGMDDYISKPIDVTNLYLKLKMYSE
jgi:CheY-like chemotaxis protein